jgi:hypothetical protein
MSRIARKQFSAKLNMPDMKIMGTLPDDISKKLSKMVITQNTENSKDVISTVNQILNCPISNVKADLYKEAIEGNSQINQKYDLENVAAVFYLITDGEMNIEIGKNTISMIPNKIYFINDRNVYRVVKKTNRPTCLMSGIFRWDKEVHGS